MTESIIYGRNFHEAPPPSEVVIKAGLFKELPERLVALAEGRSIVIVTEKNLAGRYGVLLYEGLASRLSKIPKVIVVPSGEGSKNVRTWEQVSNQLAKQGHQRKTLLVALGGGMVGDLTGFVASTYKRGISFVQVPTTLLAQVDSSIGGKTGIDSEHGKNLFGRFELPEATFIDPELLATLPQKDFVSGLGEVVKYGALDNEILKSAEAHMDNLLLRNAESLADIIGRCVTLKAKVVDMDPKDRAIRQSLNFGHTIGHGLEEASDFALAHGEAVAIGMRYEGEIAVKRGAFKQEDMDRLNALIARAGLPTSVPKDIDLEKALSLMKNDKKNVGAGIKIAIPSKFGALFEKGHTLLDSSEQDIRETIGR